MSDLPTNGHDLETSVKGGAFFSIGHLRPYMVRQSPHLLTTHNARANNPYALTVSLTNPLFLLGSWATTCRYESTAWVVASNLIPVLVPPQLQGGVLFEKAIGSIVAGEVR